MKSRWVFVVLLLGALLGTQAAMAASPPKEKACIDLGVAPYGEDTPKSREAAWRILGLTTEMRNQIRNQTPRKVVIDERWLLAEMISAGGKVLQNKRVCGSEKADMYILDDGKGGKIVLVRPEKCNNWSIVAAGVTLRIRTVTPTPTVVPPAVVVPPEVPKVETPKAPAPAPVTPTPLPIQPVTPTTVREKSASILVDGISSQKWTQTRSSKNESSFVEAMLWNGDVGVGIIGTHSEGHSKRNSSAWESGLFPGVQVGIKGSKPYTTEDGRVEKELWQVKGRLGTEWLNTTGSKGLPDRNQRTLLVGAYVENLKTDGRCLYGWVGGAWLPVGTSVNAGKVAEDRTSLFAHIRRECQIDQQWSWRVDGGPSWSAVSGTALDIAGQLRYRTDNDITFFVGPQLGYNLTSHTFFWAGFGGVQFGGVDIGILHKQYVEEHKVEATGRTGAEVFAPAVAEQQLPAVTGTTVAATSMPTSRVTSPQSDEETRRQLIEWWAGMPK